MKADDVKYFNGVQEKSIEALPTLCWEGGPSWDSTAVTLDTSAQVSIGASPLDFFSIDLFPGLASPFTPETRSSFANILPDFTSPHQTDFDVSPSLLTDSTGTSSSSTPLAQTRPTSKEASPGLQQQIHIEGSTTDLEYNDPRQSSRSPKASSQNLSTTPPDRLSCQVCNKLFFRTHELRYVPQFTRFRRSQSEISKHVKTHGRDFACPHATCGQKFYRPRDVQRHVSTRHSTKDEKNKYFCDLRQCKYATKGFSRKDNLLRHVDRQHRGRPRSTRIEDSHVLAVSTTLSASK